MSATFPMPLRSSRSISLNWHGNPPPIPSLSGPLALWLESIRQPGGGPAMGKARRDLQSGTALLKQDPRYFYRGKGSKASRFFYALASSVICKGDNGRWQPNYSSVMGNL